MGRHGDAPVAAVCDVARVAEAGHQLHPDLRHALGVVSPLARLVREAVSRHRRDHHVECIGRRRAVRDRIGERADHLGIFLDRAWPAVEQQQRRRARNLRAPMDEMNVEPIDVRLELLEFVQPPLLRAPVVLVAPVGHQALQVFEVGAVVPLRPRDLVSKPRPRQPLLEVRKRVVGHLNLEGHDGGGLGLGGGPGWRGCGPRRLRRNGGKPERCGDKQRRTPSRASRPNDSAHQRPFKAARPPASGGGPDCVESAIAKCDPDKWWSLPLRGAAGRN